MSNDRMSLPSRIIVAVASLSLIATFFLPIWFIFLIAPQYPEGLTMNIWLNNISGQVEIINGLNHYIGMKHISTDMFPEFKYMVYIVGFFIVLGLVVAITGKRKFLLAYIILTLLGGVVAMYDFYQWGKDYGSDLDPKAAIQVPGLTYQPPLVGHKQLLNFDAYSYPDIGGWVIVGAGALFILVWFYEWYKNRKKVAFVTTGPRKLAIAVVTLVIISFSSCSTEPEKFSYGRDICADCSMTIMDPKFGAEIITKKGRIYKFDDAHCVANYIKTGKIQEKDINRTLFINYDNNEQFLDAESLALVVSPQLKSPMNSNAAAFSNKEDAQKVATQTAGTVKSWNEFLGSASKHQH